MGGEGSMMAAIHSLKNNRSLLSKRKEKNALSGSYSNVELKQFPDSTPEQIESIRQKMHRDNKRSMLKLVLISTLVFVCVITLFYKFLNL